MSYPTLSRSCNRRSRSSVGGWPAARYYQQAADQAGEQTRPVAFSNCRFSQIVPSNRISGQSGHPGMTQFHSRDGPQSGCGVTA